MAAIRVSCSVRLFFEVGARLFVTFGCSNLKHLGHFITVAHTKLLERLHYCIHSISRQENIRITGQWIIFEGRTHNRIHSGEYRKLVLKPSFEVPQASVVVVHLARRVVESSQEVCLGISFGKPPTDIRLNRREIAQLLIHMPVSLDDARITRDRRRPCLKLYAEL